MQDRRLVSISVLWKNEHPGGFGFTLHEDGAGQATMQELANAIERLLTSYHEHDKPEHTEAYVEQLDQFAENRQPGQQPDLRTFAVFAANLEFLREKGRITDDNWNGVQYMYGSDRA